jgi:hypothetical protein
MLEVVIGDVHARADALRAVLAATGVEEARGREGAWVVQVGDLLDRHASSADNLAAARVAAEAVDVVLAGNHEAQLLRTGAHGAALAVLATRGWPHAAAAAGGWVITHAGIHPSLARDLPADAGECAAEINDRWHRRRLPGHAEPPIDGRAEPATDGRGDADRAEPATNGRGDPLFDWIGPARGGRAPFGGILWLHAGEWSRDEATPWGQISGHVPQREPRLLAPGRWAIDVGGRGGRLAALVRERLDEPWRAVVATSRHAIAA